MADKLTLYFTSDTHGYLYPTSFADDQPRAMGLLSMHFPKDGNTLVIDGGDTLQGSPLTYYCNAQGVPMPMATVMNAMGYDYITLGNHDFNYGQATLRAHLTTLSAQCLCANLADDSGCLPIARWTLHTLANGLRVGLVGLTTPWVTRWERPENLQGLTVSDPLAAAREAVAALREQVDVLVGIYHGGFECDLDTGVSLSNTDENVACALCEALPFDVLLTGHQHIAMANRTCHHTHVVQTPCNAAAYVRVTLDEAGAFHSELCTPEPPQTMQPWLTTLFTQLNRWLDQPIGQLSQPLRPQGKLSMALHGSPIANLFNAVQLEASGADISCTSLANDVRGFNSAVTVRDVVASYPYANTLVVLRVTGEVLREALEQCATYFAPDANGVLQIGDAFRLPKEAHYNFDFFAGIHYTFDLRRPIGQRVTRLERNGRAVGEQEELRMVTNHYRATGAGGFDAYLRCERVQEIQTEVSELLLNYLRARARVEVPMEACYEVILPDGSRA